MSFAIKAPWTSLFFFSHSNLTEIGLEAFNGCVNLTGVVIPNKVTKFGDSVFKGCSKLASVTLPTNNNFKVISPWMFAGCKKLEYINIPNTVTSINKFAFSESGLRAVVIPESVSILEKRAFWLIENLARVEINSKELVSGGEIFQAEYKDEVSEYTGLNKNLEIILPTVEAINYTKESETTKNTENTKINSLYKLGNLAVFKDNKLKGYLREQSKKIHTSFLKSLDIIAARIPAQNQQSFMPMRVVAFDNPNINTAYVSVM